MDPQVLWSAETLLTADLGAASSARRFVAGELRAHHLEWLVDDV